MIIPPFGCSITSVDYFEVCSYAPKHQTARARLTREDDDDISSFALYALRFENEEEEKEGEEEDSEEVRGVHEIEKYVNIVYMVVGRDSPDVGACHGWLCIMLSSLSLPKDTQHTRSPYCFFILAGERHASFVARR